MEFFCQGKQRRIICYCCFAIFLFAINLLGVKALADTVHFTADASFTATSNNLTGETTLRYDGTQEIENIEILLTAQGQQQNIATFKKWSPHSQQRVSFSVPSEQPVPGSYHALIEIRYSYQGKKLSSTVALEYGFGTYIPYTRKPIVELKDNQLNWILNGVPGDSVQLMLSSGPAWQIELLPLTTKQKAISFTRVGEVAEANAAYAQMAALSWVDNGTHYSQAIEWTIYTNDRGEPQAELTSVLSNSAKPKSQQANQSRKERLKGSINFDAEATVNAHENLVVGDVAITLNADEAIYDVAITLIGESLPHEIGRVIYWTPSTTNHFKFSVPAKHSWPGKYHTIAEVSFRDRAGGLLSVVLAFEYSIGRYPPAVFDPNVKIEGRKIEWSLGDLKDTATELDTTSGPAWNIINNPLTSSTSEIVAVTRNNTTPLPNWRYPQLARLSWLENNVHYSKVIEWQILTDKQGNWSAGAGHAQQSFAIPARPWRNPTLLWIGALCLVLIALTRGGYRFFDQSELTTKWRAELVGIFIIFGLTLWLISHTRPDLWFTSTWTTGGDTGSHIFYAKVFSDWFYQGKISGWLPESFTGFPAFTFYFPLPFIFISLLDGLIDFKVAFKIINMSAPFLLPAATYFMGYLMQWSLVARILAASGVGGFIVTESTSIWGGNILAALAGEFSYAWGMFFTVIFWGVLVWSLRKGGLWWLVAAIVEVLVALSHGYALLAAGFGAFFFLLFSNHFWRDLRLILQVHVIAFLLIGFWLIPLFENLPWTIPNDAAGWVESWQMLLPPVLWPFCIGIVSLLVIFFNNSLAKQLGPFIAIGGTAFVAFLVGHHFGLADVRFFPFAQWAAVVIFAASFGYLLQRWNSASIWWASALVVAAMAWWEPRINNMEGWSRWNLEGYEAKPMWPVYQKLAAVTAGDIPAPRVVFEHDPANDDLGSTRTLEAFPLFGTRPMLEGLYMESALTGPFIYQLQTEISERPSSPLSRFPTIMGSMDQAIHHMEELYTDTVILRSDLMKNRFKDDPRLQLVATTGPFIVLHIKNFDRRLIEVVDTPLRMAPRKDWLRSAYRRFSTEHPYQQREVYLKENEVTPEFVATTKKETVNLVNMERERLVFETNAIGQPHLIRMTYHPRWKSLSGEKIYLTEPAFMLIFPKQKHIELVYGFSWGNYVGWIFTILGLATIIVSFVFPKILSIPNVPSLDRAHSSLKPLFITLFAFTAIASVGWIMDPQRIYKVGHEYFRLNEWNQAAEQFDNAYKGRKLHSEKAEALFWAALSYDLAGKDIAAEHRYNELIVDNPENYWAPESVHRLIIIYKERGDNAKAAKLMEKMNRSYPDNKWTKESQKVLDNPIVGPPSM